MYASIDGTAVAVTGLTTLGVVLTGYLTYRGVVAQVGRSEAVVERKVDGVHATVKNGLHDAMMRLETMVADLRATQQVSVHLDDRPIFRTSAGGGLVWCNEAAQLLLGMSLAELTEDGWARAVHPDDAERVFSTWQECVRTRKPYGPVVYRYRHPATQAETWVKAVAQPIINQQTNELTGWVATVVVVDGPSNTRRV